MRNALKHKSESVVKGVSVGERAKDAVEHGSSIWDLLSPESRRNINTIKDKIK